MSRKIEITGIDLFAGAGGLSHGASRAGIKITHAVENDSVAADTYKKNNPSTKVLEADISTIEPIREQRRGGLILFGGPPCQGFSTSNQRTRTSINPKNWLFNEFFRFAKVLKPDWIVLENVKGLRETAKGAFEALILEEFQNLAYSSDVWMLCAADYGVPQRRYRLFFIGRKSGTIPKPPTPRVGATVTVRDAIADLPNLAIGANIDTLSYRGGRPSNYAQTMRQGAKFSSGHLVSSNNALVQKRYKHIPPGGNWVDIPSDLMDNYTNLIDNRSRHTGIYRRLSWDEPSVVISNYRKNMLIHPQQDRGLSVREAARLQSFPDAYTFVGGLGFQQQQVGNAVPPLLAEAVFTQLINHS
jgi:DNA (cytosine-5)-methyltransferase 1